MKPHLQLGIPKPCHENWSDMQPAEKGRHCAACAKTVIDFTAMSDTEIIRYMSQAGHNVCGRLAPNQINRPLIPLTPPQKNKLPAWPLLLTSLLLTHDEPQHHRQLIPQESTISPQKDALVFTDTLSIDTIEVSMAPTLGFITSIIPDTPPPPPAPAKTDTTTDTTTHLMGDTVIYTRQTSAFQTIIDTVKKIISDTLSVIPQKQTTSPVPDIPTTSALTLYPNPIPRGNTLHISWQTEPGAYHLSLFSSSGNLIQEKIVDINDTKQVSEWTISANLPAGIYFLRVLRPERNYQYTRQLVVQ